MRYYYYFLFSFFFSFSQESFYESYYEGRLIKEITIDGITVTSSLRQVARDDGKYYTFDIAIINNSNKTITFKSEKIVATLYAKNGKTLNPRVLTRKQYLKIKKRRADFVTGLMAFSAGINAANAGLSSSTTYSRGSASYYGNGYRGRVYASGTSNTISYNGAAAYAAQQNELAKIESFNKYANESKARWNSDYIKNHTLNSQNVISGLLNVKFYRGKRIDIEISIDDKTFKFEWDPKDSEL